MSAKPSALLDTRVIYCGDNIDQLRKLPDDCVDLIYIDPPFNSNRNYEVFWGETKEKRSFEDRHESTKAYIDYMRPRCVELARDVNDTMMKKQSQCKIWQAENERRILKRSYLCEHV
jgi:DNA modification methylase